MTASGRLARFNRRVANPVVRAFAGRRFSPVAIVVHLGRRSGRPYRTPVTPFRTPHAYVISLPYGTGCDRVRNVLAAGSCTLVYRGMRLELTAPRLLDPGDEALLPGAVRAALRLGRVQRVTLRGQAVYENGRVVAEPGSGLIL